MAAGQRWTRDELLLALHLYERIPFGQQHKTNPEVIALAQRLDRTPDSVAMKLGNLTSLDSEEAARGVRGLVGASEFDRAIWAEFHERPDVVEEAERLWLAETDEAGSPPEPDEPKPWEGPTEAPASASRRLAQSYFRRLVLTNYGRRCALTGIAAPELLVASHIVSWAAAPELRVNPGNGLCLNRLHDGAFDAHLVTFDEDLRLVVGHRVRDQVPRHEYQHLFERFEGRALTRPQKHELSKAFLERHRTEFSRRNAA